MLKTLTFRVFSRLICGHKSIHVLASGNRILNATPVLFQKYENPLKTCLFATETPAQTEEPSSQEQQFGGVDMQSLTDGDPELEKLLKIMVLEVDIFRQDGQLVPDVIETDEWRELLTLKSRSSRLRYLTFLFKNERKKENRTRRVEERKRERLEVEKEADSTGHIKYGFGGVTIFLRVYESTMDSYLNKGLMNAAMYSQHIVIDCSYDRFMNKFETKNCARQICMLFADNRYHRQPFHIQFCNADPESPTMQSLSRYMPPMYEDFYPFFSSPKSYLDLYPKEKLVYLTPHCRNDLVEWNHDDVYIIGAMVDKSNPKPLSLAKAKEEGLRMAKLPLEKHLVWGSGSGKSLTLNQMTNILLDRRDTGSWGAAFKHIPRRKIVPEEALAMEPEVNIRARGFQPNQRGPIYRKPVGSNEVHVSEDILKRLKPTRKVDVSKLFD